MKRKPKVRHIALGAALLCVWMTQAVPALTTLYAQQLYPRIAQLLSAFSGLFSFAVGDLFVALCLTAFLGYPLYALLRRRPGWKQVCLHLGEGALWLYVWFYAAWGLNYAQPPLYARIGMPPATYTQEAFGRFAAQYIEQLNAAYTPISTIDREVVEAESFRLFTLLSDSLGIHRPPKPLRAKTMLFSSLASGVGVVGSMAPFFCEFTLNGHLLPANYPATYAHELAHRLGIAGEAEANFYAYHVCIRSQVPAMRFSGYFSMLPHVLQNARSLLPQAEYRQLQEHIRPEVAELVQSTRAYWAARYNPIIGAVQGWAYDLYLRGNNIPDGTQNYSAAVGLIMAYEEWKNNQQYKP